MLSAAAKRRDVFFATGAGTFERELEYFIPEVPFMAPMPCLILWPSLHLKCVSNTNAWHIPHAMPNEVV